MIERSTPFIHRLCFIRRSYSTDFYQWRSWAHVFILYMYNLFCSYEICLGTGNKHKVDVVPSRMQKWKQTLMPRTDVRVSNGKDENRLGSFFPYTQAVFLEGKLP